ncbi:MAG: LysM peptidoglycan-binding domain-containing protein [Caldimicrobium sp.]
MLNSFSHLHAETKKSYTKKTYTKKNIQKVSSPQRVSKKNLKTKNSFKKSTSLSKDKDVKAKYYTVKKEYTTLSEISGDLPERKYIIHRVAPKETLYRISKKYQVSIDEIKKINEISEKNLKVGMELKIPIKGIQALELQGAPTQLTQHKKDLEPFTVIHTVKRGDTLKEIARKYNISVKELKKLNHLKSDKLKPGQKLIVKIVQEPQSHLQSKQLGNSNQEVSLFHEVKEGETLYRISLMYNVSLEELKRVNNLESNIISVGQRLKIPSSRQLPEKPFVLESPKKTLETKEENLKEKFEKNIFAKSKILTPSMLSKEEEMALRQKFIELSKNLADARYKLGGEGNGYLDCSAFVKLIYEELGIKLPRSSAQQFQVGVYVEENELIPGDLVFFRTNGNRISHVGIYLGDNRFIHISSSKKRLSIDSLNDPYFRKRYAGAKRVLNGEVLEYFQDYLNKNSLNREALGEN